MNEGVDSREQGVGEHFKKKIAVFTVLLVAKLPIKVAGGLLVLVAKS